MLWNQVVHTDREVTANRPDIIIKKRKKKMRKKEEEEDEEKEKMSQCCGIK